MSSDSTRVSEGHELRGRDGPTRPDPEATTFELLRLVSRHLAGELLVGGLRNDVLLDELVLRLVGTALDDLLGVGIADAGERRELALRRRVEVDERGVVRSGGLRLVGR